MAFADPQSITVAGTPHSMPRTSSGTNRSIYMKNDETWKLTISHDVQGNKIRSLHRVDQKKVVADPLTAENDYQVQSTYFVTERPLFGFSSTEYSDQIAGHVALFDATTKGKLYGKEH